MSGYSISQQRAASWPGEGFSRLETAICCFVFFFAPFEEYFNRFVGTYLKYVILLAIALIFIGALRRRCSIEFHWYYVFYFLWLFEKMISIYWTSDLSVVRSHFLSQFGMVGFLLVLCALRPGERQLKLMLVSMAVGSLAFCGLSAFMSEPYMSYTQRFVLTIGGVQVDPNNAAALALPAAALCLYISLMGRRLWQRLLALTCVLLSAYVILMTGSRGNLISLALLTLAVVFLQRHAGAGRRGVYILVLMALALFVVSLIPADTYLRLFEVDTYGDGSGRTELWGSVWKVFLTNPIFGAGWGSTASYIDTATHNTLLSMLAEQGIIGTLLFVAPILYVSLESVRRGDVLPLLCALCCIAPALTIDAINKRFFWDALILAIMQLRTPVSFDFCRCPEPTSQAKATASHRRKVGDFR